MSVFQLIWNAMAHHSQKPGRNLLSLPSPSPFEFDKRKKKGKKKKHYGFVAPQRIWKITRCLCIFLQFIIFVFCVHTCSRFCRSSFNWLLSSSFLLFCLLISCLMKKTIKLFFHLLGYLTSKELYNWVYGAAWMITVTTLPILRAKHASNVNTRVQRAQGSRLQTINGVESWEKL